MNKKGYHISIGMFGIFVGNIQYCFSQDSIQKDASNMKVTYFKEAIKERYKGDAFNYSINDTGGVNLIQSVLRKFFSWLNDFFGFDIDFINYQTLEYIVYGFLGVATLYLLIKFLMQSPINSVFKTEAKDINDFQYVEENLKDVHFETLIEDALNQQNYRLATRYLYLKSLKILTNKQIIEWHFDKTNSEYLTEITDENTKSVFKRISYIYEYVWYGEFLIDEAIYKKNKSYFEKINTLQHG
jgi:hypothetical protein